jgi:hypothetical protein
MRVMQMLRRRQAVDRFSNHSASKLMQQRSVQRDLPAGVVSSRAGRLQRKFRQQLEEAIRMKGRPAGRRDPSSATRVTVCEGPVPRPRTGQGIVDSQLQPSLREVVQHWWRCMKSGTLNKAHPRELDPVEFQRQELLGSFSGAGDFPRFQAGAASGVRQPRLCSIARVIHGPSARSDPARRPPPLLQNPLR